MILLKEYQDLNDVLIHLKIQVMHSIEYAQKTIPEFNNPRQLFYWLKERVIYVDDPSTIELLLTMETLFNGSRTGVIGGGDCDDFTITGLACLIASGFTKNNIVLVGKNSSTPLHIYIQTEFKGVKYWFDLTNEHFDNQRTTYKFQQILKFKI